MNGVISQSVFNIQIVESLYEELQNRGLKANIVTYGILVDAYRKTKDINNLLLISQILKAKDMKPNSYIHCGIINGLIETNYLKEALTYIKSIELLPNPDHNCIIFNTALQGYIENNELELCFDLFAEMKKNNKIRLNEQSYGIITSGLAKVNEWKQVDFYLQDMMRIGIRPNHIIYESLIQISSEHGDFSLVKKYLEQMKISDISPSSNIIKLIILNSLTHKEKSLAFFYLHYEVDRFDHTKSKNFLIPLFLFKQVLWQCCYQNLPDKALELIELAKNKNIFFGPNLIKLYDILIKYYRQNNKIDDAELIFDRIEYISEPSIDSISTIINYYSQHNHFNHDKIHLYYKKFKQYRLKPPKEIYYDLIISLIHLEDIHLALEVQNSLIDDRIKLTETILSKILLFLVHNLCTMNGTQFSVVDQLIFYKEKNINIPSDLLSTIIRAICKLSESDKSELLLNTFKFCRDYKMKISYDVFLDGIIVLLNDCDKNIVDDICKEYDIYQPISDLNLHAYISSIAKNPNSSEIVLQLRELPLKRLEK